MSKLLVTRMSAGISTHPKPVTSNVRFRWEYQPGSDLFIVYSDGRDTRLSGFPALENRSVVAKITRLFRW